MAAIDHKGVSPRLQGVVKLFPVAKQGKGRHRHRLPLIAATIAGVLFLAGFYIPALFVFAGFAAFGAVVFSLPEKQTIEVHDPEMDPGTYEWRRLQERIGSR